MLDIQVCNSIGKFVEDLTTTGRWILDMKCVKELFILASQSKDNLKFLHERLMKQLRRPHSEIRYGTYMVIDILFTKSQYYRDLLLSDFEDFLQLVVESDINKPLPKPKNVARHLKLSALRSIQKWYQTYRKEDTRLQIAYDFIKKNLKVDFQDAEKRNEEEILRAQQAIADKANILKSRKIMVLREMDKYREEIFGTVMEMDNCFVLLIPSPENFLHAEAEASVEGEEWEFNLREHGIKCAASTIKVNIQYGSTEIKQTEDNKSIIQNLRDLYKLCARNLEPLTQRWVNLMKDGDKDVFKQVLKMKQLVQSEMKKVEEFSLLPSTSHDTDSGSESDSDFLEVPDKEGYEIHSFESPPVPAPSLLIGKQSSSIVHPVSEGSWNIGGLSKETDEEDPTTAASTIKNIRTKFNGLAKTSAACSTKVTLNETLNTKQVSCSKKTEETKGSVIKNELELRRSARKAELLQSAPKLPYDTDLYNWEEEHLRAPTFEITESKCHRFWQPADREGDVIKVPDGIHALRTRKIEFSGTFQPVKWSCRAPIKPGMLCPRQDRVKCPFHGKIVARDERGNPTNPDDIIEIEKKKALEEANKPPEWQDPEYLKDLKAQIGIDLTIKPQKRGRKRKTFSETYPGLKDIDKIKNSSRRRLSKRVFTRSAINSVANDLDELTYNRHRDKFGDQFNYAFD